MAKETIVLDVQTDSSKAEGSVKSLKAQLKEAQAEVALMAEKFGETSTQAIAAAKRAAELKDKIGDAKALTDSFNPDKKFQAFAGALNGVVGGFTAVQGAMGLFGAESENVQKMLLKVQSAMALMQGLNAVTESIDAFKNLGAVIKSLPIFQNAAAIAQRVWNAAMNANPIGAIIVAITALIAGITALVSWLSKSSEANEKMAKSANEAAEAAKSHKKAIDDAAEALDRNQKQQLAMAKASGKSAEEIRKLELALIAKKIAEKEAAAQTAFHNVELAKQALESAKAQGASDDLIKKFEENVKAERENLQKANDQVVASGKEYIEIKNRQEVEKTQQTTDANNKALEKQKAAAEKAREAQKEAIKKQQEDTKKAQDDLKKIQDEYLLAQISDEKMRAKVKLEMDLENQIKEIEQTKATQKAKNDLISALRAKYIQDIAEIDKKQKEEDDKKAKENLDKQLKAEKETFDIVNNTRISLLKDAALKRQEEEAVRYQNEIDNLYTSLNNKEITEADFNARREALKQTHESNLTAIEKQNAEERLKTAQAEYDAKTSIYNKTADALGALSQAIGANTKIGKSMALAELAINTGVAISGIVRQVTKNPSNLTPFQLAADIATRTAMVIANIKKAKDLINSAKVGGGGGGGSMPSTSTSVSAPIAPQMSSTAMNQAMINQVGNAATRAFVLESDVSGNQERIRRLNRAARIN